MSMLELVSAFFFITSIFSFTFIVLNLEIIFCKLNFRGSTFKNQKLSRKFRVSVKGLLDGP